MENERDARLELAQRVSQTAELVPQAAFKKVTHPELCHCFLDPGIAVQPLFEFLSIFSADSERSTALQSPLGKRTKGNAVVPYEDDLQLEAV